jgi:hypothetical protein
MAYETLDRYTATIYMGELIDGHFTDAHVVWTGPIRLAVNTLLSLTAELPTRDFYWNHNRPF